MGAGRIVIQELKRIDDSLRDGSLFKEENWKSFIERWIEKKGTLHLLGLLQDAGVHAHQEHLFRIMRKAREENPYGQIVVHPFLDGRDTAPRSTIEYIKKLQRIMDEIGNAKIGTFMGRYYGMDRARQWKLTDMAYAAIAHKKAELTKDPVKSIENSYNSEKTPDGDPMFDEYIRPHVMEDYRGIRPGDSVMHTNYRQDRAIQLSMAFVDSGYQGSIDKVDDVDYLGFTKYYDEFNSFLIGEIGGKGGLQNLVGELISKADMRQLRISETQKFRHVTSFFNGKRTTPFEGEDQIEIKGRFDPATFAEHPEMEAYEVTERLLDYMDKDVYSFILVNYANGDMVGHTGNLNASIKAVEVLDENIGKVVEKALEKDYHILLTADHGNCEQMLDYETGDTKTSHSVNPVKFYYIGRNTNDVKLRDEGVLSDVGVTVLELLGIPRTKEMKTHGLVGGIE